MRWHRYIQRSKKCGAQAGDLVAILGIGGLGHMAVQYARRMGFKVVAIGRGADIAADTIELGAHVYIDTDQGDAVARLPMGLLVGGERSIIGSITGSPFENEKALSFSVLTQTLPMIETMPLEQANIAYQKIKSGQVKFRMVLTVD